MGKYSKCLNQICAYLSYVCMQPDKQMCCVFGLQTCFAINTGLGVLYSCSKAESNDGYYKELKVAEVVEPFVKAYDPGKLFSCAQVVSAA